MGTMRRRVALSVAIAAGHALAPPRARVRVAPRRASEDGGFEQSAADAADTAALYASLRSRAAEVEDAAAVTVRRWRTGGCTSTVAVAASDWVRRMAYDGRTVAFGTASGEVGACRVGRAPVQGPPSIAAHARGIDGQDLSPLHGPYDGGGVTALALSGAVCASGGREGVVKVHGVAAGDDGALKLETVATLPVADAVVSGVVLSEDGARLVACALDGSIVAFAKSDDAWTRSWAGSGPPALALCLDERRSAVVVGTETGVVARSTNDGSEVAIFETSNGARSVCVADDWVFAGGADGTLTRRQLEPGSEFALADARDEAPKLLPPHGDAIVALCAPPNTGGLVCSAGRDGSIRVWDACSAREPRALYGFAGFKVWIGSLGCDGDTLISDGSDNAILMHTFDRDAAERAS